MKIIYLSANMADYRAASYQADVADEFAAQDEVFFYGPGHGGYSTSDSIEDVIAKAPWGRPDVICTGHAWLSDAPHGPVDSMPHLKLVNTKVPKMCILNKEYARLHDKLAVIREQSFDLVLTHHHEASRYQDATGVKTVFWPFGFDHKKFYPRELPRNIDLFFSGLLRNPGHRETQNDLRVRVQGRLYYAVGELRLARRPSFRGRRLEWNAFSGNKWITRLDRLFGRYKRLPDSDYQLAFNQTKLCFCALSPLDLVSPRYFEAMASECVVFCPPSPRYQGLFSESEHCITFSESLVDFDNQLTTALDDAARRDAIAKKAARHAREHHTWQLRIQQAKRELAGL